MKFLKPRMKCTYFWYPLYKLSMKYHKYCNLTDFPQKFLQGMYKLGLEFYPLNSKRFLQYLHLILPLQPVHGFPTPSGVQAEHL